MAGIRQAGIRFPAVDAVADQRVGARPAHEPGRTAHPQVDTADTLVARARRARVVGTRALDPVADEAGRTSAALGFVLEAVASDASVKYNSSY